MTLLVSKLNQLGVCQSPLPTSASPRLTAVHSARAGGSGASPPREIQWYIELPV